MHIYRVYEMNDFSRRLYNWWIIRRVLLVKVWSTHYCDCRHLFAHMNCVSLCGISLLAWTSFLCVSCQRVFANTNYISSISTRRLVHSNQSTSSNWIQCILFVYDTTTQHWYWWHSNGGANYNSFPHKTWTSSWYLPIFMIIIHHSYSSNKGNKTIPNLVHTIKCWCCCF